MVLLLAAQLPERKASGRGGEVPEFEPPHRTQLRRLAAPAAAAHVPRVGSEPRRERGTDDGRVPELGPQELPRHRGARIRARGRGGAGHLPVRPRPEGDLLRRLPQCGLLGPDVLPRQIQVPCLRRLGEYAHAFGLLRFLDGGIARDSWTLRGGPQAHRLPQGIRERQGLQGAHARRARRARGCVRKGDVARSASREPRLHRRLPQPPRPWRGRGRGRSRRPPRRSGQAPRVRAQAPRVAGRAQDGDAAEHPGARALPRQFLREGALRRVPARPSAPGGAEEGGLRLAHGRRARCGLPFRVPTREARRSRRLQGPRPGRAARPNLR